MTGTHVGGAIPWRARAAALGLDAGLLAYAGWCVSFLAAAADGSGLSLFGRYPGLGLVSLPLALLWQVSDASLGQRAYGLVRRGPGGAPATAERLALGGLLAGLEVALLAAPFLLWGLSATAWMGAAVAAGALVTSVLSDPQQRSWAERLAGLHTVVVPPGRSASAPWWRRANAWVLLAALALTLGVGVSITDLSPARLWEGGKRARHLVAQLCTPDWTIAGVVLERMVETVFLALIASALALPLGFALGFLGARNVMGGSRAGQAVYGLVRATLNLTRSIEPILWAIIFSVWVQTGPFAGTLALCVHSIASLAKLYSEAIEGIDPGPVEAVRSTGAATLPVLRFGVLPQVVPALLSFTVYRWDINVRMATVLGFVGGGGIGAMLVEFMQLSAWNKVGTIIVFVTLVVWLMDALSSRVRQRVG